MRESYDRAIEVLEKEFKSATEILERSPTLSIAKAMDDITTALCNIKHLKDCTGMHHKDSYETYEESYMNFTKDDAVMWMKEIRNEDGTVGAHWTIEQTTSVAKQKNIEFIHITDYCWWTALNMVYSDYYTVAIKYNANNVDFYVDLAKAFLFDKDAKNPKHKIMNYYEHIVK